MTRPPRLIQNANVPFVECCHFEMTAHIGFGVKKFEERGKVNHACANRTINQPIALICAHHPIILEMDMNQVGQNPLGKSNYILGHSQWIARIQYHTDVRAAHGLTQPNQISRGCILVDLNPDPNSLILRCLATLFKIAVCAAKCFCPPSSPPIGARSPQRIELSTVRMVVAPSVLATPNAWRSASASILGPARSAKCLILRMAAKGQQRLFIFMFFNKGRRKF